MHTRDQSNVKGVEDILHCVRMSMHEMLCMSKASKNIFVAFMQHCIQSTVGHLLMSKVLKVSNTMYCTLYTGPLAPPGGRLFESLLSCGFSISPPVSLRRQLC